MQQQQPNYRLLFNRALAAAQERKFTLLQEKENIYYYLDLAIGDANEGNLDPLIALLEANIQSSARRSGERMIGFYKDKTPQEQLKLNSDRAQFRDMGPDAKNPEPERNLRKLLELMRTLAITTNTEEGREKLSHLKRLILYFYLGDYTEADVMPITHNAVEDLYICRGSEDKENCCFFAKFIIELADEAVKFYKQGQRGEGKNLALDLFLEFAFANIEDPDTPAGGGPILRFHSVPAFYRKACVKFMLIAQIEGRVYKDKSTASVLKECFLQPVRKDRTDGYFKEYVKDSYLAKLLEDAEKETGIKRPNNGFGLGFKIFFWVVTFLGLGFPAFAFLNDRFRRNWRNSPATEPASGDKSSETEQLLPGGSQDPLASTQTPVSALTPTPPETTMLVSPQQMPTAIAPSVNGNGMMLPPPHNPAPAAQQQQWARQPQQWPPQPLQLQLQQDPILYPSCIPLSHDGWEFESPRDTTSNGRWFYSYRKITFYWNTTYNLQYYEDTVYRRLEKIYWDGRSETCYLEVNGAWYAGRCISLGSYAWNEQPCLRRPNQNLMTYCEWAQNVYTKLERAHMDTDCQWMRNNVPLDKPHLILQNKKCIRDKEEAADTLIAQQQQQYHPY